MDSLNTHIVIYKMHLHLMKTSDSEPLSGTLGSIITVSNVTNW